MSSRRSFLKTGSAAMLGLSIQGRARTVFANQPPRVGIIGGGLAGVACAWLLDGVADAVVFERHPVLGGHAQTIPVTVGGEELQIDVGAQFFAPGTHPTYVKLLELIGLLDADHPDEDSTIEADMTIAVTEAGIARPRFVSPAAGRAWPLVAPWNLPALRAFLVFALSSKRFAQDGDWLVTFDDWLQDLRVPVEQREGILLPLVAAMTGCSLEQARGLSARSALFFIAKGLPQKLWDPLRFSNSVLGLGGNVEHLAGECQNLTTRLGSPVTAVQPWGSGYRIHNEAGCVEDVDALVFANPPTFAGPLLSEIPELGEAATVLGQFEYFSSEVAIHRDPIYMPLNRRAWSAYNAQVDGGYCEGSVWYGALRPPAPGQEPMSLFKSWATARSAAPQEEVFRQAFRHPLITPAFIQALRSLADHQGTAGVWFAGSYTSEVDSQESALTSAMTVVRHLQPQAPNLLALGG